MEKRYGNLYTALTQIFEERGYTHDDGTPIKKVGEMYTEAEYREIQKQRLREKTNRFRVANTSTEGGTEDVSREEI